VAFILRWAVEAGGWPARGGDCRGRSLGGRLFHSTAPRAAVGPILRQARLPSFSQGQTGPFGEDMELGLQAASGPTRRRPIIRWMSPRPARRVFRKLRETWPQGAAKKNPRLDAGGGRRNKPHLPALRCSPPDGEEARRLPFRHAARRPPAGSAVAEGRPITARRPR